jgi:chorismate mutase-like protein
MSDLDRLRNRIDALDRELINVVAQRLAVCEEVARFKEGAGSQVIQPDRVRDVVTTRRQWAIDAGVDPDFAEQLVRVLLSETHRIEVAGHRQDAPPPKVAGGSDARSAIDTAACRIDHVVVFVDSVADATRFFVDRLGFHLQELADGDQPGIGAVSAGGVTVVLLDSTADPSVAAQIDEHGSGVQHIAIEVLNAGYVRASLEALSAPLLTDVVVDDHGHEQFFTVKDPATGVQLGFISRTGHRVGFSAANIRALLSALNQGRDVQD